MLPICLNTTFTSNLSFQPSPPIYLFNANMPKLLNESELEYFARFRAMSPASRLAEIGANEDECFQIADQIAEINEAKRQVSTHS
jgi:hypothetical protein